MEPLPLLPQINSKACPDTSHIIREEFQELLQTKSFPEKIARNFQKFNSENLELKKCGVDVNEIYIQTKMTIEQIDEAESFLLKSQGKYFVQREKEGPLPNIALTTMPRIYEDPDQAMIQKYHLLQYDDILPHITERIIDPRFRIETSQIIDPCVKAEEKQRDAEEYPFLADHLPKRYVRSKVEKPRPCTRTASSKQQIVLKKPIKRPPQMFSKLKQIDKSTNKIDKATNKIDKTTNKIDKTTNKIDKTTNKTDEEKLQGGSEVDVGAKEKPVFKVKPRKIVFDNFEKNVQYEKTLFVYNITTQVQNISSPILPKDSKYTFRVETDGSRIAPGMRYRIIIGFKADSYREVLEELIIKTSKGPDVHVNLLSYQIPPFLQGILYEPGDNPQKALNPAMHNAALNYCIDCGSTLLGYCTEFRLKLKAFGTAGRYFLISEEDWVFSDMGNITEDLHLHLESFHLSPSYFQLDDEEEIDVEIFFHPRYEGFHTEKVFIVCDNNSMIEIDVIGDCLNYEKKFFCFQFLSSAPHVGKSKEDPAYSLHLGPTYFNQVSKSTFWVHNLSPVKIKYGWTKEATNLEKRKSVKLLPADWIEISPKDGVFNGDTTVEFTVSAKMASNRCGIYSHVLSLYVYDIPSIAIEEGPVFDFGEEYYADSDADSPQLISILVGKIEVQVRNMEFPVYLAPENVNLQTLLCRHSVNVENVKVCNDGFEPVTCEWMLPYQCSCTGTEFCKLCNLITFDKCRFLVEKSHCAECRLTICPGTYDDIDLTISLSINDGYATRQLRILAEVEKPQILVQSRVFNFGHVRTLQEASKTVTVYNNNDYPLKWAVYEYTYDPATKTMAELDCYCHLGYECGELCHKGSFSQFAYTLDTREEKQWLSVLVFCTIYDGKRIESTHTMVLADIRRPKVVISDEDRNEWALEVKDEMFLSLPRTFTLFVENETVVGTKYRWGQVYGMDELKMAVEFECPGGNVYPLSRKKLRVTLVPLEYGRVEEFFIPVEVDGVEETMLFRIKGFIQCLRVMFSIPFEDRFTNVYWPSDVQDDTVETFDLLSPLDIIQQPEEEQEIEMKYDIYEPIMDKTPAQSTNHPPADVAINAILDPTQFSEEQYPGEGGETGETGEGTMSIFTLNTPEEEPPTVEPSTKKSSPLCVMSYFESEITTHDIIVDFSDTPLRTPVKKTIFIENLSEIGTDFEVIASNFEGREPPVLEGVEQVLLGLKWKVRDEFVDRLSEHGIVVLVKPEIGELPPKGAVGVDIWVYAETWGVYLEEICISVGEMPTFFFNLLIEVVGMPLEYPVIKNTEMAEPVIKFGCYGSKSDPESRKFWFTNVSTIPFTIVWKVLNETPTDDRVKPFNVFYDIFGLPGEDGREETKISLRIDKFIGQRNPTGSSGLFKVTPRETYVGPKGTTSIDVRITPELLESIYYSRIDIVASLIGHVYIEEKYRILEGVYTRPVDQKLPPVRVKMTACVEEPHFDLENFVGSTRVAMSAEDVERFKERTATMKVVLKNRCSSKIIGNFSIREPFHITNINSLRIEENFQRVDNNVEQVVHENEDVEILVKCHLPEYFMKTMSDLVYSKPHRLPKSIEQLRHNLIKIQKSLKIYSNYTLIQELPFTLLLGFPCLNVSTNVLNFGTVYLGCTKVMTLLLTNLTTYNTWFCCNCSDPFFKKSENFRVEPENGIIPPTRADTESVKLSVYFNATSTNKTENILCIETWFEQYKIYINLTGTGTNDEKYFVTSTGVC